MKTIYVLTNPEDGWDCISEAYSSLESFLKDFPERFLDEDEDEEELDENEDEEGWSNEDLLALFSKVKTWAQAKKFVQRMGFIIHEVTLHD